MSSSEITTGAQAAQEEGESEALQNNGTPSEELASVAVLGATGSIGTSALDVIARYPDRFRVTSLSAGRNYRKLAQLASVWRPSEVGIADESLYRPFVEELKSYGVSECTVLAGKDVDEMARSSSNEIVIQSVVGAAGVRPSFYAAMTGKRLLLANKESLVCGGESLMRTVADNGGSILPVDSEHNAIFQCLDAAGNKEDRDNARLLLTCSGGPFRAKKDLDLSTVTPEMALAHPTWSMGRKISIDSATLMNKGLEVIEAHHLFGIAPENISVVVHPQSVIHSMVEFSDGSVIAQLASPDMRLPIAYCLGWPKRIECEVKHLDFKSLSALTFEDPDTERFPQLAYAYEAIRRGGNAGIILNAANEIAVEAFLEKRIAFTDIAGTCRAMMDKLCAGLDLEGKGVVQIVEEIEACDAMARAVSREYVASIAR